MYFKKFIMVFFLDKCVETCDVIVPTYKFNTITSRRYIDFQFRLGIRKRGYNYNLKPKINYSLNLLFLNPLIKSFQNFELIE